MSDFFCCYAGWSRVSCSRFFSSSTLIKISFWLITEIHHFVHEQDGAAVSRATTQRPPIDGLRQTRSTSKHKQRNHEATTQGTEYRRLQATKKKSGHDEEAKRREEEAESIARRAGCELLVKRSACVIQHHPPVN